MNETNRSIDDVFCAAIEIASDERTAWLDQVCGNDPN